MARTVQSIQTQITAYYVLAMAAIGITVDPTKWSRRNKQQAALNTFAVATGTLEQNFDAFTEDVEAIIAAGAPGTPSWIQYQCLNRFQYDATTPQIPQLDVTGGTLAPLFPTPDDTKKIITQCVVVPGSLGTTSVKAAKTAGALSGLELSALQSFLNLINISGININASSSAADKIYIKGTVTYLGGYSAIIQAAVVAAIDSYLQSIPTSGIVTDVNSSVGLMKLTSLIAAVKAVPGVTDFSLEEVNARADGTTFTPGSYNLVSGSDWLASTWQSGLIGAGYMVTETAVGYDINTSLTYNAI